MTVRDALPVSVAIGYKVAGGGWGVALLIAFGGRFLLQWLNWPCAIELGPMPIFGQTPLPCEPQQAERVIDAEARTICPGA